jgi:hypothetical protein
MSTLTTRSQPATPTGVKRLISSHPLIAFFVIAFVGEWIVARLTGIAMTSNGSIAPVQLPAELQGPLGLIPVAVVIFYLVVPVTVAAIVFRKRDMLGAA